MCVFAFAICVFVSVLAKVIIWNTFIHTPEPHQVLENTRCCIYTYMFLCMYLLFLGQRGPHGIPLSVRPLVSPQEKF